MREREKCTYLVWSITRHTRSKHNTPFNSLLDKRPGRTPGRVKTSIQIDSPQLLDFLGGKLERGLVLGASGIADHAVQSAGRGQDLVDGGLDGFFLGHVGLYGEQAVRESGGERGEFCARGVDVDGVDGFCAVGETAVCYAETDSWSRRLGERT